MTTRIVAGHIISDTDNRCERCGRSVHDVMSYVDTVKVGDEGIACVGVINANEIYQMQGERERRGAVWAAVVGVAG